MPELKKQVIQMVVVDYRDLEQFIEDIYDHKIELVGAEEWNNDSCYELSSIDGEELDDWDRGKLVDFITGGGGSFGITRILLNDLAQKGLVETGDYLITVSW